MADLPNNPNNREEEYLADIAGLPNDAPDNPWSRKEAYLDAISGRVSGMASDISDLNQKVAALATDFSYKGSVATYADLPANPAIGDVYTTEDEGYMYVWDGNSWQILNMQGGGGGPTVVQTTGTSTTDVMSQDATTKMIQKYPSDNRDICIGPNANVDSSSNSYPVAVGSYARATGHSSVAIGGAPNNNNIKTTADASGAIAIKGYAHGVASIAIGSDGSLRSSATGKGSIALGAGSSATAQGQVDIGTSDTSFGYSSSNYRLLTGLYDPQSDHDAATKGYVDTKVTMTTTDPGEGQPLAAGGLIGVYE